MGVDVKMTDLELGWVGAVHNTVDFTEEESVPISHFRSTQRVAPAVVDGDAHVFGEEDMRAL